MKNVSQNFKNELKNLGRQLDVKITYTTNNTEIILDSETLNSVVLSYEGNLLKSIMKTLVIDSNDAIPKDTEINVKCGILVNSAYEYIDYGNFIVTEINKKEDTNSFEIKSYDKLIYSMKEYETLTITYPCTIGAFITSLATKLGYTVNLTNGANLNLNINSDVFENLGYTYRDVLDDLAEATGTTIYLQNTTLTLGIPTYSGFTVDEESLKDVNVNFGEKYRSCKFNCLKSSRRKRQCIL